MGTSAGALAGSLYCAGYTPRQLAKHLSEQTPASLLRPSISPWRGGALSLDGVIARLRDLLPPRFEDLDREFAVGVVTADGQHLLLDSGPLPEAVAASAAIPFIFEAVEVPGQARYGPLKDGGVVDRVGLRAWRERRRTQLRSRQLACHLNGNGVNGHPVNGNGVHCNGYNGNGVRINGLEAEALNGLHGNGVHLNGHGANGVHLNALNGDGLNGHGANWVHVNGHGTNGYSANGVHINGLNGDAVHINGDGLNGHSANGVHVNGHAHNGNGTGHAHSSSSAHLRPPPCLVHVIDRSSPFSGFDDMDAMGESHVLVVHSPRSGANFFDLGSFEEAMGEARHRALARLRAARSAGPPAPTGVRATTG